MVHRLAAKTAWIWLLLAGLLLTGANAAESQKPPELLIYCGITLVRPMTEIARLFEQKENIKITLAQGGSEDLYQSARKSQTGDLYLMGEPTYRARHLDEGLLGDFAVVGYNSGGG